ncbi:non-ribosomal peptide synthetase, partial [Pseudomonas syringae]
VVPAGPRLRGALDSAAREHSLSARMARHETLRTTFRQQGGQALQIGHPPRALILSVESLPSGQTLDACVQQEMQRPFDLAQGPLLRVRLLYLNTDVHVLILAQHHTAPDGWSLPILVDVSVRLYGRHRPGSVGGLHPVCLHHA